MRISDWSSEVCSSDLFLRSMGVTIWWNEGIYVSPVGRYSVMLPQNKDLMAQVVSELQEKAAKNVVASLQAGTISFVAPGELAEETIRPYLIRLGQLGRASCRERVCQSE